VQGRLEPRIIDPAVATMIELSAAMSSDVARFQRKRRTADPNAKFELAAPSQPDPTNPSVLEADTRTSFGDRPLGPFDWAKDKLTARYEFDRFGKAAVFNPLLLIAYTDATFHHRPNALITKPISFPPLVNDSRFGTRARYRTGPSPSAANVTAFARVSRLNPLQRDPGSWGEGRIHLRRQSRRFLHTEQFHLE